jgi:hypothetical protein
MNEATKIALQISLNEKIKRREQLIEMAEQYKKRAQVILHEECEFLNDEIRQLQADLGDI